MKNFKLLYCIMLPTDIVLGNVYLGGSITLRYVLIVTLFLFCIKEGETLPKRFYITGYFLYILTFCLTSIFAGYFTDFIKNFITYFLDSIVWIWATHILIKKYSSQNLIIYTLLFIGVINAIVTIGQHFLNPLAFEIAQHLNLIDLDITNSIMEKSDSTITEFCLYGILGAVPNGYYSSVFCVLSLYLYHKFRNILFLVLYLLFIFSLYCVQERAAFVAGVFFSLLFFVNYLYRNLSTKRKTVVVFVLIILTTCFAFHIVNFNSLLEGTRYESFELGSRSKIYSLASEYIWNKLLTANMFDFFYSYGLYPHNLWYNAFIYGGLLGGIIILFTLVRIIVNATEVFMRPLAFMSESVVCCYALFAYTVVSFTHNASIVTGDMLFWILALPILEYTVQSKT